MTKLQAWTSRGDDPATAGGRGSWRHPAARSTIVAGGFLLLLVLRPSSRR